MQCLKDRDFNIMDMMHKMDLVQEAPISSEDRLFMTPAPAAPTMQVIGGRLTAVRATSGFPVNGQQLQMQLDSLTSAMTDMMVEDDEMQTPCNPAYTQYIQDRTDQEESPFSQGDKRRDPVYLTSMASHTASSPSDVTLSTSPNNNTQQQLQQQLQQQQHEFFLAFLNRQQITPEQFQQQQQYYQQLLEQQYAQQQQQQQLVEQQHAHQLQLQQQQQHQQQLDNQTACCIINDGGRRLLKRPDLIPMQKCTMWT